MKIPDHAKFGAIRKFDIHTGIDLYFPKGTAISTIESGVVVAVEIFTGPNANSLWWNETFSVLVEGESGVICYGEIFPMVSVGQKVSKKQVIGTVMQVLKKDKGKEMSMLHLELYKHGTKESCVWNLGVVWVILSFYLSTLLIELIEKT